MPGWFKKLGWSDDVCLKRIEDLLKKHEKADYKIVVGHHPVGYSCIPVRNTRKIDDLIDKYGYHAYLHGHLHSLGFAEHKGRHYYLSGAGGEAGESYPLSKWH